MSGKKVPLLYEFDHQHPIGHAVLNDDGTISCTITDKHVSDLIKGDIIRSLSVSAGVRVVKPKVGDNESQTDVAIQTPDLL